MMPALEVLGNSGCLASGGCATYRVLTKGELLVEAMSAFAFKFALDIVVGVCVTIE